LVKGYLGLIKLGSKRIHGLPFAALAVLLSCFKESKPGIRKNLHQN